MTEFASGGIVNRPTELVRDPALCTYVLPARSLDRSRNILKQLHYEHLRDTMARLPLPVWQCTHCALVRNKPCARVCRLDTDHPDTVCWNHDE